MAIRPREPVSGAQSRADAALLTALRAGDEDAFVELVRAHHSVLLRVALTYVSDRAVAEEVVQDTWVGVLTGVERFEGRASVRTWMVRIAANIARRRAAREWRSRPYASLPADRPGAGPAGWDSPEERLMAAETQAVLRAAIARLPPVQRLVVTLRDVEGWPSDEVCDALDLTPANQRVVLHRGRVKVRDALERHLAAVEAAA